jgi:hypothetical protein
MMRLIGRMNYAPNCINMPLDLHLFSHYGHPRKVIAAAIAPGVYEDFCVVHRQLQAR